MAKKNGKWVIAFVTLVILVLGCIMTIAKTYFVLPAEVEHHADDFAEMKKENNEDHKEFKANDKAFNGNMIELKTDVKYMREDIKEIKDIVSQWEPQ